MGLIKNNYFSKSTGLTLPTAYAILKDLVLNGNNARAIFVIQSSRNATENFKPLDKVEVRFEWDRKTDIAKLAYETAKTQRIKEEVYNEKFDSFVVEERDGVLFGWNDDKI